MTKLEAERERAQFICNIVAVGLISSFIFHYIKAFYYLPYKGYPLNTFLYIPEQHFGDFDSIYWPVKQRLYESSVLFVYFPFAGVFLNLIGRVLVRPSELLAAVLILPAAASVAACSVFLRKQSLKTLVPFCLVVGLFNYGLFFTLDRANLEGILFFFLAMFFISRHYGWKGLELLFLSCAIAMKGYPAALGLLYLPQRRYRDLVFIGIITVLLSLSALWVYPFSLRELLRGLQSNLAYFKSVAFFTYGGAQHNSSLYNLLRFVVYRPHGDWWAIIRNEHIMKWHSLLSIVFTLLCILTSFFDRKFSQWKIAVLAITYMVLIPPVSFDYKMIHFVLCAVLFIENGQNIKSDWTLGFLIGLLLVPKDYYQFHEDTSISALLFNPLLMLIIAFHILIPCWLRIFKKIAEKFEWIPRQMVNSASV